MSLEKDLVNKILSESLNLLEVSSLFNASDAHEFFLDFVTEYICEFSEQNIDRLINYSISDNIWSGPLISSICDSIINKRKQTDFLDEKLFNRILNRTSERRQHSIHIADITPFYMILIPELKPNLYQLIKSEYSKDSIHSSGINPFSSLHKWGIWNPIENVDMFELFLNNLMKYTKNYPDIYINDKLESVNIKSYLGINELYFFVILIYKYKLNDDEKVQKVYDYIKSNMFKWALKPKEFDYSIFDYKWIGYLKIEEMYPVLREIPDLMISVRNQLASKYNSKVSKIYFENLCN